MQIENLSKKLASKSMTIESKAKDYGLVIIVLLILKLITNAISISTSYYYLNEKLTYVIKYSFLSSLFTILLLLSLESIIYMALDKTFKFSFRHKPKRTIFFAIVSLLFYSASFFLSTQGIKNYMYKQKNNSVVINKYYSLKKDSVINEYKIIFSQIEDNLKDIIRNQNLAEKAYRNRPADLSYVLRILNSKKNKINLLLYDKKESLKNELKQIETLQKSDLKLNSNHAEKEGQYYYYIVASIMIAQIIFTFFLFSIYAPIHNEQEDLINEQLKDLRIDLREKTKSFLYDIVSKEYHNTMLALNSFEEEKPDKSEDNSDEKNENHRVGFNSKQQREPVRRPNETEKTIEFLNRHFIVAKTLIENYSYKNYLSNNEIKLIQKSAKNAKYKSRTTVMKVFTAMQTAGIENLIVKNNEIKFHIKS